MKIIKSINYWAVWRELGTEYNIEYDLFVNVPRLSHKDIDGVIDESS
jgi:hypothetical protein